MDCFLDILRRLLHITPAEQLLKDWRELNALDHPVFVPRVKSHQLAGSTMVLSMADCLHFLSVNSLDVPLVQTLDSYGNSSFHKKYPFYILFTSTEFISVGCGVGVW